MTPGGGQVDSLVVGHSMLVFYKFSKEEEGERKGGEWYRDTVESHKSHMRHLPTLHTYLTLPISKCFQILLIVTFSI
jgi:hypothetical protein